jgi:hypothetical protein
MQYRIKENSIFARIGAWKLRSRRMAMTIGNTIHLYNTSQQEFLEDQRWLRHELKHVEQYQRYGLITFLWMYTVESIQRGYYLNRFEIEAREAESGVDV